MTTTRGHSGEGLGRFGSASHAGCLLWIILGWLAFTGIEVQAGPLVTTDSPIGFFTNVASRLLQSQLGVSLNHIQIYPTNQYTPSVHRLLQVTANLYDAATNRTTTGYPYLPSVFRPVFAGQIGPGGSQVYISGYSEVTAADTPNLAFNWMCRDLSDPNDRANFKPGTDMVYGIPLIIGAKMGFPSFNKLAMQTQVQVTRKLQFHRPGDSTTLPVNEIDQMYVVGISNVFGVEAWNSYAANFSRDLQMVVWPDITVLLTNRDTGKWLNQPPLSSRWRLYPNPVTTNIAANTWSGYDVTETPPSFDFQIPLTTNLVFLTNSAYSKQTDAFVPLTGLFERPGGTNFYLPPHWELTFKPRLRFAMIDTATQRIVDYVNLADCNVLDVTNALMTGGRCGFPYYPDGSSGSMWCTDRVYGGGPGALSEPTFGIYNQIAASAGQIASPDWRNAVVDAPPGVLKVDAISFFYGQFIPGYPYASNTFNAPYQPFRNIYLVTSWQANDPLVHYMLNDLVNPVRTNVVVDSFSPVQVGVLGVINSHYEPWGGSPGSPSRSATTLDLTVKDPLMFDSDCWDFPTNPLPNLNWIGRVHRGTPWQTIYLKAPATSLVTWTQWTGNSQLVTNWNGVNGVTSDAFYTQPTNDWRLASLVLSLLNTNDPRNLASVNPPGVPAWCGLLDGMTVLTNNLPDDELGWPPQFASLIMSSNSPQASTIAAALVTAGSSQPGRRFHDVGDILATPELSTASPWLNTDSAAQVEWGITDEAYEVIPSQLLLLLRPDSIGSVGQSGGTLQVQFTGADGYAYAVQTSSNLLGWTAVSTNYPTNGCFNFVETPPPGSPRRFYRSVLWP